MRPSCGSTALTQKVREGGRTVAVHALIATGVNAGGHLGALRRALGFKLYNAGRLLGQFECGGRNPAIVTATRRRTAAAGAREPAAVRTCRQ